MERGGDITRYKSQVRVTKTARTTRVASFASKGRRDSTVNKNMFRFLLSSPRSEWFSSPPSPRRPLSDTHKKLWLTQCFPIGIYLGLRRYLTRLAKGKSYVDRMPVDIGFGTTSTPAFLTEGRKILVV